MIRCGTEAACQRAAERLCRLLGAEQTMRPSDSTGRGWITRVVLRTPDLEPTVEPRT